MAVNSFQALDKDGNAVTVYDSDDPAEAGGATLEDIRALLDKLDDALQSVAGDQLRVAVQSTPSLPAGSNNIGAVDVTSLPDSPAQTGDIQSLEDAVGDETVANAIEDPTVAGSVQDLLGGVLALLRGALSGKDADDQLRVDLQSEAADLSSETTLSDLNSAVGNQGDTAETNTDNSASALAFLKGVVDLLGGTLTVTDDGALAISSLPSIPAGSNNIGSVDVASLPSVTIGSQTADLSSETTLSSVLTELQGPLDVSGATVTVADNGSFGTAIDSESAGIVSGLSSVETAVRDKEHYRDVLTGGQITLGSALSKTADGFEVLTSGTVEVNTTSGTTRQFSASPGRIYPIGITQFTGNTGLAASDLLAWIR
jgi:hypothetical protein